MIGQVELPGSAEWNAQLAVAEVVVPADKIQRVLHVGAHGSPGCVVRHQVFAPGGVKGPGITVSGGGALPGNQSSKPGAGRPGMAPEIRCVIDKSQLCGDGG